jgi:hypothetical protein
MVDDRLELDSRERFSDRRERGHIRRDTAAAAISVALPAGELDEVVRSTRDGRIDLRGRRRRARKGDCGRLRRPVTYGPSDEADGEEQRERSRRDQNNQDVLTAADGTTLRPLSRP